MPAKTAESLHPKTTNRRQRAHRKYGRFLKPQSLPPWHTSSNKTASPIPYQIVLPTEEQVFKPMSLNEPLSINHHIIHEVHLQIISKIQLISPHLPSLYLTLTKSPLSFTAVTEAGNHRESLEVWTLFGLNYTHSPLPTTWTFRPALSCS